MILVAKFLFHIFLIKVFTAGTNLYPLSSLSIVEKNGFLTYLNTSEEFGKLQNCTVLVSDVLFDLYQSETETHIYLTERFEKLQRFSQTECGIRVQNVSIESAGEWIITASDTLGRIEKNVLKLTVLKSDVIPTVTNVSVTPGQTQLVACPALSALTTPRRCRMIDIFGYSVESCTRTISWRQSERHFTCRSLVWGSMVETVNVINVYRQGMLLKQANLIKIMNLLLTINLKKIQ